MQSALPSLMLAAMGSAAFIFSVKYQKSRRQLKTLITAIEKTEAEDNTNAKLYLYNVAARIKRSQRL